MEDFLNNILPLIGSATESSNSQTESMTAEISTVCKTLETLAAWAARKKSEDHMNEVSQLLQSLSITLNATTML